MKNSFIGNLRSWLRKPFPFYETYRQKTLIPIVLSFAVMTGIVFLNWTTDYSVLRAQIMSVIVYGSVVIATSICFSLVLPEIFPKIFNPEKWNIQKTLTLIFLTIATIGLMITLVAYNFDNAQNLNFVRYFITILIRSLVISFFPIILLLFYFERTLYKKHYITALNIIDGIKKKETDSPKNAIQSLLFAKNTKDEIRINEDDLIYIKAEGNYCSIFYLENSIVVSKLIRGNMKEMEKNIGKRNHFIRCHKSYIINLSKISDVTGNARGYLFHFANYNYKIPGSRNLSKQIINKIKDLKSI